MFDVFVARTAEGLTHLNTLGVPTLPVRFQTAPGAGPSLGIPAAPFAITFNSLPIGAGDTNSDGEVPVPLFPLLMGTVTVRIFDTDYELTLHPGLQALTRLDGQQKRMEVLGYVTGYLNVGNLTDTPDSNADNPETQQAIMNFQTDRKLAIDGAIGPATRGALKTAAGV